MQTTCKGRVLNVTIQAWYQMLMRGSKHQKMYNHPFTLLRINVTDDTNQSLWKPMWLIVMGNQREEISPTVANPCYRQRFDIEHMLRFGKQRLLMTEFQTPSVEHEENWIRLVMLAYVQLWAARELASHLPRPWERYLEQKNYKIVTPSLVQRDFRSNYFRDWYTRPFSQNPRKFNWSSSGSGSNATNARILLSKSRQNQHLINKKQRKFS